MVALGGRITGEQYRAGTRLRHVEQKLQIRQGAALELLRTALDDLVEHYGRETDRSA